jgi:hypothetical protein
MWQSADLSVVSMRLGKDLLSNVSVPSAWRVKSQLHMFCTVFVTNIDCKRTLLLFLNEYENMADFAFFFCHTDVALSFWSSLKRSGISFQFLFLILYKRNHERSFIVMGS